MGVEIYRRILKGEAAASPDIHILIHVIAFFNDTGDPVDLQILETMIARRQSVPDRFDLRAFRLWRIYLNCIGADPHLRLARTGAVTRLSLAPTGSSTRFSLEGTGGSTRPGASLSSVVPEP